MRLKYLSEGEQIPQENGPRSGVDLDADIMDAASKIYDETYNSFYSFFDKIFSIAIKDKYGEYVSGDYIKRSCDFLQYNQRTMYLGPRGHLKSVRLYAYIAWKIWRNKKDKKNIRIDYLSYNQDLAAMHVENLKDLINRTFFFAEGLYDEDSTATSKASYIWLEPGARKESLPKIDLGAYGILGGLRGGHPQLLIVDDPYQNDMKKNIGAIEPDIVKKINIIFDTTVLPMPLFGDELHVTGTPQSYADLWFNQKYRKESEKDSLKFNVRIEPAYKHYDYVTQKYLPEINPEALWPELFPLDGLKQQEEMLTTQQFKQEYLCTPRSSAESFFEIERIEKSIEYGKEIGLINHDNGYAFLPLDTERYFGQYIFATYDPGQMKHPAHFAVFAYGNGKLTQLVSKFMDNWDYAQTQPGKPCQFGYISDAVHHFQIQKIYGDNTNSVLKTTIERGEIPGLTEVKITHSLKGKMAYAIQKHLGKTEIRLLDDSRQKESLLAVQNEGLKIVETSQGHGEFFTTLGFAVINTLEEGKIGQKKSIRLRMERDKIPKLYRGHFFNHVGQHHRTDLPFPVYKKRGMMSQFM